MKKFAALHLLAASAPRHPVLPRRRRAPPLPCAGPSPRPPWGPACLRLCLPPAPGCRGQGGKAGSPQRIPTPSFSCCQTKGCFATEQGFGDLCCVCPGRDTGKLGVRIATPSIQNRRQGSPDSPEHEEGASSSLGVTLCPAPLMSREHLLRARHQARGDLILGCYSTFIPLLSPRCPVLQGGHFHSSPWRKLRFREIK